MRDFKVKKEYLYIVIGTVIIVILIQLGLPLIINSAAQLMYNLSSKREKLRSKNVYTRDLPIVKDFSSSKYKYAYQFVKLDKGREITINWGLKRKKRALFPKASDGDPAPFELRLVTDGNYGVYCADKIYQCNSIYINRDQKIQTIRYTLSKLSDTNTYTLTRDDSRDNLKDTILQEPVSLIIRAN